MDQVTGIQTHTEKRDPYPVVDDLIQRPTGHPYPNTLIPACYRLIIGSDELLDIIPDLHRELGRVLYHESSPAVEGTPYPISRGKGVSPLNSTG